VDPLKSSARACELTDDASLSALASRAPSVWPDGGGPRSLAGRSGVHRLMLAILEDAIALYVKSLCAGVVAPHEARAARTWLESRDCTSPFAFESICDVLGLDSSYIRRGMRTARARPLEAATRLAIRHHGRRSRPAAPPPARAGLPSAG